MVSPIGDTCVIYSALDHHSPDQSMARRAVAKVHHSGGGSDMHHAVGYQFLIFAGRGIPTTLSVALDDSMSWTGSVCFFLFEG